MMPEAALPADVSDGAPEAPLVGVVIRRQLARPYRVTTRVMAIEILLAGAGVAEFMGNGGDGV
jgi:hypothetical protein